MQKKTLTAAPANKATFQISRDGSDHFTCTVMAQTDGGAPMGVTLQAAEMSGVAGPLLDGLGQMISAGASFTSIAGVMLDAIHAMAMAQLGFEDDGVPYPEPVVPEPVPTEPDPGAVA